MYICACTRISIQYQGGFVFFPITLDHQKKKNPKTFTEGFSLFIDFRCNSVTWEKETVKEVIRPPLACPTRQMMFETKIVSPSCTSHNF
jgi:hypothetical protein